MRLPSIERLVRAARIAAGRFPLALLSGAVAAATGVLLPDASIHKETLEGVLYVSTLGIPLFLAVDLMAERNRAPAREAWIARIIVLVLLVAVYAGRPSWSEPVRVLRYVQLSVAAHLLVALAPYGSVREWNGFWHFNCALLFRFALSAIFSAVLYVGLSVALLAIDNLLAVDVEPESYFRLWCVIAFLFNTWFFVSGIPADLEALETRTEYPPVLKVFAQYILSPLVALYLLIITVYLGRVLVTHVWPSGWIGYLVSSVAAAGILSLLLLYPIEEREENRWVRHYARWFFIALIPANAMLLLAIWKRIQQYAVTEPRYFLVVLSVWLAGVSLFYAITRSRNIKVIPATLAALALLTFAGPWSAYAVSRRSQTARLEGLLARNGMLVDGRVRPPSAEVPFADQREISAVLRYLTRTHGTGSIEPWFPEGRLTWADRLAPDRETRGRGAADELAAAVAGELGIGYVGTWAPGRGESFEFTAASGGSPIRLSGYDYASRGRNLVRDTVRIEDPPVVFAYDEEGRSVRMLVEGREALSVPLDGILERAIEATREQTARGRLPAHLLTASAEGELARLTVAVTSIGGVVGAPAGEEGEVEPGAGTYTITSLGADFYFTVGAAEE